MMSMDDIPLNFSISLASHSANYAAICLFLVTVCVVTRIITGQRSNLKSEDVSKPKDVPVVPYFVPWLGSAIPFGLRFQDFLAEAQSVYNVPVKVNWLTRGLRKSTTGSVFAVALAGNKHNVVTAPGCTKQILNERSTLSNRDLIYYMLNKFFGDRGAGRSVDPEVLFSNISKQLHGLMREPFLSNAIAVTVRYIQNRTPNLVSFAGSWVDQTMWERAAHVEVVPSSVPTVEASLFPLVRNFVGDLACEVLMGRNFMENNPNILEDLWTWDGKFNLFLLGLPAWLPGLAQASQARVRVRRAVQEFQEALFAVEDGRDPGSRWDDMSDVSPVMVNRAREWRKANASVMARSAGDLAVLWAMNVNANQVVFWLLWHVYSDPELLVEVRHEVDRYIKVITPKSELPIAEPERLDMNIEGLRRSCPLLKASYFETMRLDVQPTTYRTVTADFTVTESPEDAAIAGMSKPRTYKVPKGQYVCVPHSVHQRDDRYFKDPTAFNPKRFYVIDKEKPDEITVDMGSMHPFGGGSNMCKGRNFAEREVLAFAAAILATWDIEPVEGKWLHPGAKQASGTVNPVKDVRVRMRRREK